MPNLYSLGGTLVSKEEYEKAHGINQPEVKKEEVEKKVEVKTEVKPKVVKKKK